MGQKLKLPKTFKNYSTTLLELLGAKNRVTKGQSLEKSDAFENQLNWPLGKGYSLCKIVNLGQKLKLPKTFKKLFYNIIRVVVPKKPLYKRPNFGELGRF